MFNLNNMDRFGFYQTPTQNFYNKFEAIQHSKSNDKITWNFNRSTYDHCKWDQEPTDSLDDLYRQRAEQLRQQYDYIVLLFSGGADSSNILNAFINNDIKLDEVASIVNYEATGDKLNWLNAEIYHVAGPKVETARLKQPGLIHTIVDIVPVIQETLRSPTAKFDWIYDINRFVNPYNASKRFFKMSQQHWREMITAGKKVCFVHGSEKPLVNGIKDRYFFRFFDAIDTAVPPGVQRLNRPWEFDELFYWTPDLPQLVIKQAHVVKNFLKHAGADSPHLSEIKTMPMGPSKTINEKTFYLTSDMLHILIYPGWYPVPYQHKPKSIVFSPRDEWIFNLPDSDHIKYTWRVGIDELWRATPNIYKNNPADMSLGFKTMYSGPYSLGS